MRSQSTRTKKSHIVFLFSDTGGGHRSAANAIIEALELEFPGRFTTEMVDFFKDYAPPPLNFAGPTYPAMSKMKTFWGVGYRVLDDPIRMDTIYDAIWPYIQSAARKLISEHPCDLMVSVHSLVNYPAVRSPDLKVPYITVVVDLVTAPAAWYQPETTLLIAPTEAAYQKGLKIGIDPAKMYLVGLPISEKYCIDVGDRTTLRRKWGWKNELPVILLVGGGEGMGRMEQDAYALDEAGVKATLVVVTGRNEHMLKRMQARSWQVGSRIYGFVRELNEFMRAADMIITKAGPTTICEAFVSGLPIIISSYVPGQERGNVIHVVSNGAGVYAPTTERVVSTVQAWLKDPAERAKVAAASLKLARPRAARQIAKLIAGQLVKTGSS
jgi:1,2-diacylglycerol 3-beta-galactosyltransferase